LGRLATWKVLLECLADDSTAVWLYTASYCTAVTIDEW
jgi:hypothetical protein